MKERSKKEKKNHNGMRDKKWSPMLALPKDSAGGTESGRRFDDALKVKETVERAKQNFGECSEGESEAALRSEEAADTDVRRRVVLFKPL